MLSRAFQRTVLVILDLWVFCVVLALVYHTFLLHDAMKFEEAMETLQLDWWIFEPNHILWAFQHHVIFTHGQHSTQSSNSRGPMTEASEACAQSAVLPSNYHLPTT